uniref:Tyrosine-protein kinase n=1 Tax=Ascaris suum TaxID=6253 RepID=F1L3F1_ASCSU
MGFLKEVRQKLKSPKPDSRDIISADDDEFESITVMSSVSSTSWTDDPVPEEVKNLPYYHGFLPRQDAEDMVIKVGDFLVRRSEVREGPKNEKTWMIMITIRVDTRGPEQVDHISVPWNPSKCAWECGRNNDQKKLGEFISKHIETQRSIMDDDNRYKLKHPVPRHNWQMRHAQVVKEKQIGHGAYGEVWKGYVRIDDERFLTCAIKCLPEGMISTMPQRLDFIKEAHVCRLLQHENIVKFRGIAIDEEPIMMLLEWCENGSLLDMLRNKGSQLTLADRTRFCMEAAQGLRYLEKNNVIHRDVAARNCLLNVDMVVKMADFGLSLASKFYKETKAETKMPIRWLAPESLGQNVFSSKTDVWSYGVLMNEIYTNGEIPYPNLTLQEVWKLVTRNGIRIVPPSIMQPGVVALMRKCFEEDPNLRPTFLELKLKLRKEYAALTKKPGGLISFFKRK